jgi:hypothetical protein
MVALNPRIRALGSRLAFTKPFFEAVFSLESRLSAWWAKSAHHRLYMAQWGLSPEPEFFEHKVGLYWLWEAKNSPHWVERGVFSLLAMKPGCKAPGALLRRWLQRSLFLPRSRRLNALG